MKKKGLSLLLTGALVCAISLPIAASAAQPNISSAAETDASAWIDDDPEICTLIETLLTRAGMAEQLYAMAGRPAVIASMNYSDVPDDFELADAVGWAAGQNLIDAYPDGSFRPTDIITREEAVTALWRYAGSPTPASSTQLTYQDSGEVSDWARNAYAWAYENNLLFTEGDFVWWAGDEADDALFPQAEASWDFVAALLDAFTVEYGSVTS